MSSMKISRYHILLILIAALVGILLLSTLTSTSVYFIKSTDFGLASRLPFPFWIGLILLCCLWYASRRSKYFLIVALIYTFSFLYLAPTIIRVPVWISNSYYPYGESLLIDSSGHLSYRPSAPAFSYISWPIFLYLASAFKIVTGMPDSVILKYFPVMVVSMYGVLAFLILRTKLKTSYSIVGGAWFLGIYYLRQQYFGPQSIAYMFFLFVLFIICRSFLSDESKGRRTWLALIAVLSVVVAFTHLLTCLMLAVALVAFYLTKRFVLRRPLASLAQISIFSVIVFLSYNMFFASGTFDLGVLKLFESLSGIGKLSLYREASRVIGSPANTLNYYSSWSIVVLNAVVALVALFLVFKHVRNLKKLEKYRYSIFWGILLLFLGLYALTSQYGHHESYQRAFMFGLVPLTFLCVDLLKSKPKILFLVLGGLLLLNIPAQYGSDSFRLATDTQLAGSRFFAAFSPQNTSCFAELSLYVRYYEPLKNVRFRSIVALPLTSYPNSTTVNEAVNDVDYVFRSDLEDNYYLYYMTKNPLDQVDFSNLNTIYDNGGFLIIRHPDSALP